MLPEIGTPVAGPMIRRILCLLDRAAAPHAGPGQRKSHDKPVR
jgi:hypothetical protein